MNTQIIRNKTKGFVLFVALLTASFLLAVGLGISSLAIRGFQLTSNTAESIRALYAANAGIECALYWDLKYKPADGSEVFPLVHDAIVGDYIQPNNNIQVSCSENVVTGFPNHAVGIDSVPTGTNSKTIGFWLSFRTSDDINAGNGPCVYITINKDFVAGSSNTQIKTTVDAYGYNLHGVDMTGTALTCIPGNISSSPANRVERVLEAAY